jgi:hypothetical protein
LLADLLELTQGGHVSKLTNALSLSLAFRFFVLLFHLTLGLLLHVT